MEAENRLFETNELGIQLIFIEARQVIVPDDRLEHGSILFFLFGIIPEEIDQYIGVGRFHPAYPEIIERAPRQN